MREKMRARNKYGIVANILGDFVRGCLQILYECVIFWYRSVEIASTN